MADLIGKVALVTGAARGQGRAHALALAAAGADIIATDICQPIASAPYDLATPADLAQTVAEVEKLDRRVVSMECDIRSSAALDAAVSAGLDQFGKIDILIANAGIWALGRLWELTDEQWQDVVDTNLTGAWRSVKAVVPAMIENGGGSIVLTSSVNGFRGRRRDDALRRRQAWRPRPDAQCRPRARALQHPLQRRLPRHRRHEDE